MALTVSSSTNGTQLFAVGSSVARVSFFNGQLLTQRDLQAEQRFHLLLQRVVQREGFGTGTVAGLEVTREFDTATLPLGVFITPGLAFDPGGREILLEQAISLDVASAPLPVVPDPFTDIHPGDGRTQLAAVVASRFTGAFGEADLTQLVIDLAGAGLLTVEQLGTYLDSPTNITDITTTLAQIPRQTASLPAPLLLREWLYNELVGQTYIGVKYRESGTNPAPALLEAACCGTTPCFPTRTQESVFVVASDSLFPAIEDPFQSLKLCLDAQFFNQLESADPVPSQVDVRSALCSCLLASWRGNPPLDTGCQDIDSPILPLAKVFWSRFASGSPTQILSVDNCSIRPLAPGGPAIRALLESLSGWAAPTTLPPRAVLMSPPNGAVIAASDTIGLTLKVSFNATLAPSPSPDGVWELLFYPTLAVTPTRFAGTSASGPGGSAVTAHYVAADGSTTATAFELSFAGGAGFDLGTYVFRLMNGGSVVAPAAGTELVAATTNAQLDGEANPPAAVPSGDGRSGGAFETRFVVTSG